MAGHHRVLYRHVSGFVKFLPVVKDGQDVQGSLPLRLDSNSQSTSVLLAFRSSSVLDRFLAKLATAHSPVLS